jgi:hypothetical protein
MGTRRQRDFVSDDLSTVPHFVTCNLMEYSPLVGVGIFVVVGRSSLFLVFEDGDCFLRSDNEATHGREPFEVPPLPTLSL